MSVEILSFISVFYLIQLYDSDVVCLSIPDRVHNIVWIHLLTLSFHKISHNNIFCLRPLLRSSYSFLSLFCIFFCMSLWTIAYSLLSELELTLTVISHNSRLLIGNINHHDDNIYFFSLCSKVFLDVVPAISCLMFKVKWDLGIIIGIRWKRRWLLYNLQFLNLGWFHINTVGGAKVDNFFWNFKSDDCHRMFCHQWIIIYCHNTVKIPFSRYSDSNFDFSKL